VDRTVVKRVLIVFAVAASAAAFLLAFSARHGSFDLEVYYGAVNYWAHGRGEIYDFLQPMTKYGFTYPPFAALTMLPMAVLPWWLVNVLAIAATVVVTITVLYWFLAPVIRRQGWSRWFAMATATILVALFEPLRETLSFGQVNMLLVFVVVADLLLLVRYRSPLGGVGIGLATAVKLTPGIFILYLVIARRFRAAALASATTLAATVLAGALAPDATREFWTSALWDTDRVGSLSFISNQSLEGFVARLHPSNPNTGLWILLVLGALALWGMRVWRAARVGDDLAGLALTGVVGLLISPVTWIHHMVWLLPALLVLVDRGLAARGRRRILLLTFAGLMYVLLCSRAPWNFSEEGDWTGWGVLGSNSYVFASIILLAALPIVPQRPVRSAKVPRVTDLGELDDRAVWARHGVAGPGPVGREAGPGVEPPRPLVGLQNP
jgi:alpha-1,2-mannosyltransferase